jgi:hypothetical protein
MIGLLNDQARRELPSWEMLVTPRAARLRVEYADTATGVSWSRCSRRCAVTTTSSTLELLAAACLFCGAAALASWARAGCQAVVSATVASNVDCRDGHKAFTLVSPRCADKHH